MMNRNKNNQKNKINKTLKQIPSLLPQHRVLKNKQSSKKMKKG